MHPVIVRIGGGLGNQLFEFAHGLKLAELTGRPLLLELNNFFISNFFPLKWRRQFLLDAYEMPARTKHVGVFAAASYLLLWCVKRALGERRFLRLLSFLHITWLDNVHPELFDPAMVSPVLKDARGPIWVSGTHCHLPLMPNHETLRRAFTLRSEPNEATRTLLARISNAGDAAVSIHIRRTDYLENGIRLPGLDYYDRAICYLKTKIQNPRWFVFSDDIAWCETTFANLPNATFIHGDIVYPQQDLRLMSACPNHILANSTFSWWGAYLGTTAGISVYPAMWLCPDQVKTLIPENWEAL